MGMEIIKIETQTFRHMPLQYDNGKESNLGSRKIDGASKGEDSNSHGIISTVLSPLCLPIPSWRHWRKPEDSNL